jgi:protein disulfide-isomerase-like protein
MQFRLNNIVKKIKSMFSQKNLPTLLLALVILLILYYLYFTYVKEGFQPVDLEEEIKTGEHLVLFYADWCGHCKKIKPVWDEASSEIKHKNKKMLKVNCGAGTDEDKEIMKKYNIDGYPTIILFKDGQPTHYEGPRNKDALIKALS